ncbi:hypothetical protein F5Y13DRAFT_191118 [Hypoxylon sp. FL1857]|nr:hypothetical protein F5Y13DRAFT_191118 [Hypoxylon sp. FL1857]
MEQYQIFRDLSMAWPLKNATDVYKVASNTHVRLPEGPEWWHDTDKCDDFLESKDSEFTVIKHDDPHTAARYIAIDAIRWATDNIKSLHGLKWEEVRIARPVIFAKCTYDLKPPVPPVGEARPNPVLALESMLNQFYYEFTPIIPLMSQSWRVSFFGYPIRDKIRVLEEIPYLRTSCKFKVEQHICIIAGLDVVWEQLWDPVMSDEISYVRRFIRVLEKLFIHSGKGKILLVCRDQLNLEELQHGLSIIW